MNVYPQSNVAIKVGSKKFTENVILGEIITQLVNAEGVNATHLREIGGTRVLWNALTGGDIDIYPEYTGTIKNEILASQKINNDSILSEYLSGLGIKMSKPLGFNDTYALGMKREKAEQLGIEGISDLRKFPGRSLSISFAVFANTAISLLRRPISSRMFWSTNIT